MELKQSLHPDLQLTEYRLPEASRVAVGWQWSQDLNFGFKCSHLPRSTKGPRKSSSGMEHPCTFCMCLYSNPGFHSLIDCKAPNTSGESIRTHREPEAPYSTLLAWEASRLLDSSQQLPLATWKNDKQVLEDMPELTSTCQHLWLLKKSQQTVSHERCLLRQSPFEQSILASVFACLMRVLFLS